MASISERRGREALWPAESASKRRALRSSRGEEGREGEVQAKRRNLGRGRRKAVE